MFTIKTIHRGGAGYHAYEASQYTADGVTSTVSFQEAAKPDATLVCLGRTYERIVVENSAGKTIENMAYHPGVPKTELPAR